MSKQLPPDVLAALLRPPASPVGRIRRDGDLLVLPSGCTLPQKCIKTNRPVTEKEMTRTTLTWSPSWVYLFVLLGGLPLIIAYLLSRQTCQVTFGLDREVRKKNRKRILIKAAVSLVLLGISLALAMSGSRREEVFIATFVSFVLFFISFLVIFVGNSPLRATKFADGMFWIRGCSPEFLNDLEF